jgi:hypothetical protein
LVLLGFRRFLQNSESEKLRVEVVVTEKRMEILGLGEK